MQDSKSNWLAAVAMCISVCSPNATSAQTAFDLGQRKIKIEGQHEQPLSNAIAPSTNLAQEAKLRDALARLDFRALANQAGPDAIPIRLRDKILPESRSGLVLKIKIAKVDLLQPAKEADWWLRVDVTGTLHDRSGSNRLLWQYQHQEIEDKKLNGRQLAGLSFPTLLAKNSARLKMEISLHLRYAIHRVLGDLDQWLAKPQTEPTSPTSQPSPTISPHIANGYIGEVGMGVSLPVGAASDQNVTGINLHGAVGYQLQIFPRHSLTPRLNLSYTQWGWKDGAAFAGNGGGQGIFNLLVGAKYSINRGPVLFWAANHLGLGWVSATGALPNKEQSKSQTGFALQFSAGADYMFSQRFGVGGSAGLTKTFVSSIGSTDLGSMGFAIVLHLRGKLVR